MIGSQASTFTTQRSLAAPSALVVGLILTSVGTSSAAAISSEQAQRYFDSRRQTASSQAPAVSSATDAPAAMRQLRLLTGLTWEQLASVFGVSRRAVHFWANGEPMTAANEQRLSRVLAMVRRADRGSAEENRALLFAPNAQGITAFDLLLARRDQEAALALGEGPGVVRSILPISPELRKASLPLSPLTLVDTLPGSLPEHRLGSPRKARAGKVGGRAQG
jgi:transcriptional regulator with XRE-family HTH domain